MSNIRGLNDVRETRPLLGGNAGPAAYSGNQVSLKL